MQSQEVLARVRRLADLAYFFQEGEEREVSSHTPTTQGDVQGVPLGISKWGVPRENRPNRPTGAATPPPSPPDIFGKERPNQRSCCPVYLRSGYLKSL